MTPEEVAARHNKLLGFRLVDYHSVALPLWLITFDALVIAEKKLPVVDEFILRAVERQVNSVADLAGFLGLSEKLILRRIGTLISSDYIASVPQTESAASYLKLTPRGLAIVHDAARTPPRREKLVLAYDAIARQPIAGRMARESLRTPQQIKQYGLFELPSLPGRLPDETELGRINYNTAIPKDTRKDQKIHQVLSANKIGTMARRYREAVMLIYCGATDNEQVAVRFFSLEGRPMPEVDRGFQQNRGLQRLSIQEQLKKHRASLEQELSLDGDYKAVVEFSKAAAASADLGKSIETSTKLAAEIAEKEKQASTNTVPAAELEALKLEIEGLKKENARAQQEIEVSQGRILEPHEHVPLFEKGLREARKRLLVISPWVYDSIMEPKAKLIEDLLRRKVEVYIGFGISEHEKDPKKAKKGERTLAWLQQKAAQYKNLFVVRLGNTHAKVLLVDDRFLATGSFNWMSFGGFDHNDSGTRVVREELSHYVTAPAIIEKMFVRYKARFAKYFGAPPTQQPVSPPVAKVVVPVTPLPKAVPVAPPVKPPQPPSISTPAGKKPENEMRLTPKMIATHLGRKPYVIIATAIEAKHFATIDAVLPDSVTRAIYISLGAPLPTHSEVELLKKFTP
jgi:hypothetical protein